MNKDSYYIMSNSYTVIHINNEPWLSIVHISNNIRHI
jgi:hypothetical protein